MNIQAHREVIRGILKYTAPLEQQEKDSLTFALSIMDRITRKPNKEIKEPTLHRVICEIVSDCEETELIEKAIVSYLTGEKNG